MKYALITGASGGIGAATARDFARRGWGVAVHYHRGKERAEALAAELSQTGVPVMTVEADVADPAQVQKMVDNVLENFCQLDILVCNAGLSHVGLLSDIDEAQWRRLFAVNVDGVYHCCQAALPHFIHRKSGSIVTVSSMWGQVGASCEVAYSATKGAVIAFTKALAKELGPSHIRVNSVAPGAIDTEMNRHLSPEELAALAEETPLERLGQPEEVAKTIAFLASDEASFLTGQVLSPNGGLVIS
jgi:3-oxoacyl-[acyl-carrier protein] reductase